MDESEIAVLRDQYEEQRPMLIAFSESLAMLIQRLCVGNIAIESVAFRVKETRSLADKLRRKPRYHSLADVTDKCGIRVVARYNSSVADILKLLHDEFDVVEHVRHGSSAVSGFGYSSDHVLLRLNSSRASLREWREYSELLAEVQVRSILQHAWAAISHNLDYKSASEIPSEARRPLFRVAAILETADEVFDTYRQNVEAARATYDTEMKGEDWRDIDVNLDSVVKAWQRLPIRELILTAQKAGFEEFLTIEEQTEDLPALYRERDISDLVRLSALAGLSKVGDIERLMLEAAGAEGVLRQFIEEVRAQSLKLDSESSGVTSRPRAIAPDIASLFLVIKRPNDFRTIDEAMRAFNPPLVSAAVSIGFDEISKQGKPSPQLPSGR